MINAGILVFDEVEELDFTGPFEVLSYVKGFPPESMLACIWSANSLMRQPPDKLRIK